MNWVGGARNRIKLKQEKKQQQEYFEKKRFTKRAAVDSSKACNNSISQDLVFLQTVVNCSDSSLIGGNVSFQRINFEEKYRQKQRIKVLELPMSPSPTTSQLELAGPQDDQLTSKSSLTNSFSGSDRKNISAQTCIHKTLPDSNQHSTANGKAVSSVPSHLDFLHSFSSEGRTPKDIQSSINSMAIISEDFQELNTHFPYTNERYTNMSPSISPSSLEMFKNERHTLSNKFTIYEPEEYDTNINAMPCTTKWNYNPFQQLCDTFDDDEELASWHHSSSISKPDTKSKNVAKWIKSQNLNEEFECVTNKTKFLNQSDVNQKNHTNEATSRFLNPDVIMYQTQPFLPSKELVSQQFEVMKENHFAYHEEGRDIKEQNLIIDSAQMVNTNLSLEQHEEMDFLHCENSVTVTNTMLQISSLQETSEYASSYKNEQILPKENADVSNLQTRLETIRNSDMLEEFFELEESHAPNPTCNNVGACSIQMVESDAANEFGNDQAERDWKYLNNLELDSYQIKTQVMTTVSTTTEDPLSHNENQICNNDIAPACVVAVNNEPSDESEQSAYLQSKNDNESNLNEQQMVSIAVQCSIQLVDAHTQTSAVQNCHNCDVALVVKHLTNSVVMLDP